MKLNKAKVLAVAVALSLALAGCSSGGSSTTATALTKLGANEKTLTLLGWPGYAEDGSNDPKVDWVTPFEQQTGCQVTFKSYGTSDEALSLFKTGQYDAIAASGDATLRLIAGNYVQPLNTDLIPSYKNVYSFLKGWIPHKYWALERHVRLKRKNPARGRVRSENVDYQDDLVMPGSSPR